jgi:hypothetical protein
MASFIKKVPLSNFIIISLTLGLAPFSPPHIYEKLALLFGGNLSSPTDWFDLCLHGGPWILLLLKIFSMLQEKNKTQVRQ